MIKLSLEVVGVGRIRSGKCRRIAYLEQNSHVDVNQHTVTRWAYFENGRWRANLLEL